MKQKVKNNEMEQRNNLTTYKEHQWAMGKLKSGTIYRYINSPKGGRIIGTEKKILE